MGVKVNYFQDSKLLESNEHAPCFSSLRTSNDKITTIHYYLRTKANKSLKEWWISTLQEWGFEFEALEGNLFVVKLKTFLDRTIVLMLLRYLDSCEDILDILKLTKEWSEKFPEYHTFHLFQLSHWVNYNKLYFNYNHTIFTNATQKLVNVQDFLIKIDQLGNEPWVFGVVLRTTESTWMNSAEINEAIKKENVPELINLLS